MTVSIDFSELGLAPALLRALKDLGYEQPSPIQAESIPALLTGCNLLGTAQTGTGKTAAFALPLLSRLDNKQKTPQLLVLTPTRELAIQVAEAFKSYGRYVKGFSVLPVYGGQDMQGQLRALRRGGVQVVVGTPGRIMDHMRRKSLNLGELKAVVLDEADEMLRMGFIDDVETILADTPKDAQRALFSATMPAPIKRITVKYIGDAKQVCIENKTTTVQKTEQSYLYVSNHHKLDALTRVLEVEEFDAMIVFVRTKSSTVELAEKLSARGFAVAPLNGDLSQTLRERTVNRLKNGQLDIIVATDVAARGLDVQRISHVFNYDIPYDTEAYVHRIGRTGRAGRTGKAILFVTPKEKRLLRTIEKATRQSIKEIRLPTSADVSEQRIKQFESRLLEQLAAEPLGEFRALISGIAAEKEIDLLDIAAALSRQIQGDRPLFPVEASQPRAAKKPKQEKSASQRDKPTSHKEKPASRKDTSPTLSERADPLLEHPDIQMVRYRLEAGKMHDVTAKDIVGAIANEAEVESQYIGRIHLFDDWSTVDLPEGMPKELLRYLQKVRIRQQIIKLKPLVPETTPEPKKRKKRKPRPKNKPSQKTN